MSEHVYLPLNASLPEYQAQVEQLRDAWAAGHPMAVHLIRHCLPRFLDERIPWLPKNIPEAELLATPLHLADFQLAVARGYDFLDWPSLTRFVEAVTQPGSPVQRFEAAVEAVVNGDAEALRALLRQGPDLVHARSSRITHFDPNIHAGTLLHYIGANGVENYRQKTPPNAVEITRILLESGAEPDSLADLYGGKCTTMSMLVSSNHPAEAGLQVALVDLLVDFGASVEARGEGTWTSPVTTAITFGFIDAAEALVRRGARIDTLPVAAGLGRLAEATQLLPAASPEDRHQALAHSAQMGHTEVVQLLLDAGEDPNRFNPKDTHAHTTPLHQAVWSGHDATVRLLVERGARLDIRDTTHHSTPLGWAEHGGRTELAEYLRSAGAPR